MNFARAFAVFKYSVYALLVVNIYLFFRHATFHEGMDAVGWVTLLAMFEWETRKEEEDAPHSPTEKIVLPLSQLIAYGLILYAWGSYYLDRAWMDFINASLWLAVVLTIYADLYWKDKSLWRTRRLHHLVKVALYAGLIVIAVLWGMEGDILNFYDAFLWIVCFFAVEMNLLQHIHHRWQENNAQH